MTNVIANLIKKQKKEFVFDYFNFKFELNEKNEGNSLLFAEELNIISNDLLKYINDDHMFIFPVSFLYQIFVQFYTQNKFESLKYKEKCKIINFLLKLLDKIGRDASILFIICDFGEQRNSIIEKLLNKYTNVFDFNLVSEDLLKYSINLEQHFLLRMIEYRKKLMIIQ